MEESPVARLEPQAPYSGRELINLAGLTHGTLTSVGVVGLAARAQFSTPHLWHPNYDLKGPIGRPIQQGDQIVASKLLCALNSVITRSQAARGCEALPAPRIRHPSAGEDRVSVTQSVTGARIRVYDGTNAEIGDGRGTVVILNPILKADDVSLRSPNNLGSAQVPSASESGYVR